MTHLERLFQPPLSDPGSSGAGDVPPEKPPRSWKKTSLIDQLAEQVKVHRPHAMYDMRVLPNAMMCPCNSISILVNALKISK